MGFFSSLSDQQSSDADELRAVKSAKRWRTAKSF